MTDAPTMVTERLELWLPRAADMRAMHEIVLDPRTGRFLGPTTQFHDYSARFLRNAGSWHLYGYGAFTLRHRGQRPVIGNCGVFHAFRGLGDDFDDNPEAGWIVAADHVGQGLADEAMRAALAWFDRAHGARRIVCMISPGNEPSMRLAAKLGFTPYRHAELPDGAAVTLLQRAPA